MTPADGHRPLQEDAHSHSWPHLFGQLIVHFTEVIEAQVRLVGASIVPALTAVLNGWLLRLIAASVALTGLLLLLCASILLLHEWLRWWQAFGIMGVVSILAAMAALASLD